MERRIAEKQEADKEKSLNECTFQPDLSNSRMDITPTRRNLYERGRVWTEEKKSKLQKEKEFSDHTKLKGCTFFPEVSPLSNQYRQTAKEQIPH